MLNWKFIFKFAAMLSVHHFTFNPFQENTYIIYNEEKRCIIIDPGMYNAQEEMMLENFIATSGLKPEYLINTHCHIDHILGNTYCAQKYNLVLRAHTLERSVMEMGRTSASLYNLRYNESVPISIFMDEKDNIKLGNDTLKILFTPGHSPGSLSFYDEKGGFVIAGDALFRESIGRTDLPGGDYSTLIQAIREKLFALPDATTVYSGHGPSTTIGHEKLFNPFLLED